MKITSKIKKQIDELAKILNYGIEWSGSDNLNYRAGSIECAAFIVSCKIVQEILIPAKTKLDCLGASDVINICNLFENPTIEGFNDALTKFLQEVE